MSENPEGSGKASQENVGEPAPPNATQEDLNKLIEDLGKQSIFSSEDNAPSLQNRERSLRKAFDKLVRERRWWNGALSIAAVVFVFLVLFAVLGDWPGSSLQITLGTIAAYVVILATATARYSKLNSDVQALFRAGEKVRDLRAKYDSIVDAARTHPDTNKAIEMVRRGYANCHHQFSAFDPHFAMLLSPGNLRSRYGDDFVHRIRFRLMERRQLLLEALEVENKLLTPDAACIVQSSAKSAEEDARRQNDTEAKATLYAVDYRLAVTDLFVEKAQYHLESRALGYKRLGYLLYGIAVLSIFSGSLLAVSKMVSHEDWHPWETSNVQEHLMVLTSQPSLDERTKSVTADATDKWIDLLKGFLRAFTAYGFIVLTSVVLIRGARACLDQRERLLAKRHSLRQGRLYLHLKGGHVSIDDFYRVFDWNRDQHNAFTHMPTEAKAPFGAALEELVKIVPELVKLGSITAGTKETEEKKGPPDSKNSRSR